MDVTLIIAHHNDEPDVSGKIIGQPISLYAGRLTEEQALDAITSQCNARPHRVHERTAVCREYDASSQLVGLTVTFSHKDETPFTVDVSDSDGHYQGESFYARSHAKAALSYEVRYAKLKNQPGVTTYFLSKSWDEPSRASEIKSCRLTEAESDRVEMALEWLREHAGEEWALASWDLRRDGLMVGDADLVGLDAVLDELMLNSRYDEDPSFYGEERYGPFEARRAVLATQRERRQRPVTDLPPFEGMGGG